MYMAYIPQLVLRYNLSITILLGPGVGIELERLLN